MKVQVVIDNISKNSLLKEWGLCIYIEYGDKRYLLDSGSSAKFADNAGALGIDLSAVDYAVLSHAHYDHANGMKKFFSLNGTAPFYLREGSGENCYHHHLWILSEYIGIKRGWLKKFSRRIRYASGVCQLEKGVYLLGHTTPGLEEKGRRAKLWIRENGSRTELRTRGVRRFHPDDFRHEQSLVFETEKGLVIFNSCSHGGADTIIKETAAAFPGKKMYGMIGGFHLFCLSDDEVRAFARRVRDTGIEYVVTGHCTGQRAYEIMHEELGDKVIQMYSGLTVALGSGEV